MKSMHLFATRLRTLWILLPPILLLIPTIIYNGDSDAKLFVPMNATVKLYPLMAILILTIIFMIIYFFRMVSVRIDEIRCAGPFSSKDRVDLKKERAIVLTLLKHGRIRIEVFGSFSDDLTPHWLKEEDGVSELNLFRTIANGGARTVKKILTFFGIDAEDAKRALAEDGVIFEDNDFSLSSDTVDKKKSIRLYFKETI